MIALYIILGIIAFFALVLSLKVSLNFVYKDKLSVYLRILFIRISLLPSKKKKFNAKKHDKKQKKKASKPTHVLKEREAEPKAKPTLSENIEMVTDVLRVFLKAFPEHLHVRLAKIHIKVASPDAAQTAILYGTVSGAVAVLVDLLNDITNLDGLRRSSIIVVPDFLSDKPEAELNIALSLRVYGALSVLIKMLIRFIKHKFKK